MRIPDDAPFLRAAFSLRRRSSSAFRSSSDMACSFVGDWAPDSNATGPPFIAGPMSVGERRRPLRGSGRSALSSALLPSLDLVELGQGAFKLVVEEPHRIENFAEGCRCFCPVSLSKGEDAVVA